VIYRNGDLTPEFLRSILSYDEETGLLHWRVRRGRFRAGEIAGRVRAGEAGKLYVFIEICDRAFRGARIVWVIKTGAWPDFEVDHKDGDGTNNRWANLRPATREQQTRNMKLSKRNTSGRKGVSWDAGRGMWKAYIRAGGPMINLGRYPTKEEAIEARREAEARLHGEYARAE
jgi:hypothetical protein